MINLFVFLSVEYLFQQARFFLKQILPFRIMINKNNHLKGFNPLRRRDGTVSVPLPWILAFGDIAHRNLLRSHQTQLR